MSLKKQVITVALTALLSTVNMSDIQPVFSKEKHLDYEAKTFFDLDDKGEKLDTYNFIKSSISLENIKIKKNKAVLKDKGHSFDHIFGVGHYENRGTKEFKVKTTLTCFNPMKEKNRTETFQKTVSLDYNSK
ncbi:hypothetical protein [Brevibacillus laterosporus]|uniref:hypothetical protein n=1 Tax=Brevibacillus laterosporus TaxID=1465 RepID=UPI0018F895E9|nr:hypothetical protein [Brevibacillus laterosporus]MBG9775981.1 hypothetical protein [Brevibacillus laterosporus]